MYTYPYPQHSDIPPLKVPYKAICIYSLTGPYEFDSFNDYAIDVSYLRGLIGILSKHHYTPAVRNAQAQILQSWLFFGLAAEALGRDVHHNEFVERITDQPKAMRWIDPRIPKWFSIELRSHWNKLRKTLSTEEFATAHRKLEACVEQAFTKVLAAEIDPTQDVDDTLDLVLFSIQMLLFAISIELRITTPRTRLWLRSTQLLTNKMIRQGWCRKRLNLIEAVPIHYPTLYFLASLPTKDSRGINHQACTQEKCSISAGLLPPLHCDADCQCGDVQVPLLSVSQIVARGGIPLVRIISSTPDDLKLEIVPYKRTTRFTAVSHVWADRQLGSTQNALPKCRVEQLRSMLSRIPRNDFHFKFWQWLPMEAKNTDDVNQASGTYELFWLDTFCVPQSAEHVDLRRKALESMNLVYAAASQTLIIDIGLQSVDVGQRPSALLRGGHPSYSAPADESLLDTLAHICTSNWMGRAWTLQEGVLSSHCVFQMRGSLAFLRLLIPGLGEGFNLSSSYWMGFFSRRWKQFISPKIAYALHDLTDCQREPLHDILRHLLFELVKHCLDVTQHRKYARGSAAQTTKFIKAYSMLQSRSTTMPDDIPLILANLAGLNGNQIARITDTDERMRLMVYCLDTVPIEFLLSSCERIKGVSSGEDRWIPREIVPEIISGEDVFRLGPEWFTFTLKEFDGPLNFFMPHTSVNRDYRFLLKCTEEGEDNTETTYLAEALIPKNVPRLMASHIGWCVLLHHALELRGARFFISRMVENKIFLHFDCALRLQETTAEENASTKANSSIAAYTVFRQGSDQKFIIERSSATEHVAIARPQNSEQYSDRLMVVQQVIWWSLLNTETRLMNRYVTLESWSDLTPLKSILCIAWFALAVLQHKWTERLLQSAVHSAWIATYQPNWNPYGAWRWVWKLMNFEPWIPFKTLMKYFCVCMFFVSVVTNHTSGMLMVTCYWLPFFDKRHLGRLWVWACLFWATRWIW